MFIYTASSSLNEFLPAFAMNYAHRQWFTKVFLSLCSNFHYRIMQCLKIIASNTGCQPCPLHTENSPDSPNVLMLLYTGNNKIPIYMDDYTVALFTHAVLFTVLNPFPSFLLRDSVCLGCSFCTHMLLTCC